MISNTQEESNTKSPKNITKNKNVTSTINKTSEITSNKNSDVIQNNTKTTERWSDMISEGDEIPKDREQPFTLKRWSETPTKKNFFEIPKETEKVRPNKHPKQPQNNEIPIPKQRDQSTKKTSDVYNQKNFTRPKPSYNTHKKYPISNSHQEQSASFSQPNEQQSIPPEKKDEYKTAIIYLKNFLQDRLLEVQTEELFEREQEEQEEQY